MNRRRERYKDRHGKADSFSARGKNSRRSRSRSRNRWERRSRSIERSDKSPVFQPPDRDFIGENPSFRDRNLRFEGRSPEVDTRSRFEDRFPSVAESKSRYRSRSPVLRSRSPVLRGRSPVLRSRSPRFEELLPNIDRRSPKPNYENSRYKHQSPHLEVKHSRFEIQEKGFDGFHSRLSYERESRSAERKQTFGRRSRSFEDPRARFESPTPNVNDHTYDERIRDFKGSSPGLQLQSPHYQNSNSRFERRSPIMERKTSFKDHEMRAETNIIFEDRNQEFEGPRFGTRHIDKEDPTFRGKNTRFYSRDPDFEHPSSRFEDRVSTFEKERFTYDQDSKFETDRRNNRNSDFEQPRFGEHDLNKDKIKHSFEDRSRQFQELSLRLDRSSSHFEHQSLEKGKLAIEDRNREFRKLSVGFGDTLPTFEEQNLKFDNRTINFDKHSPEQLSPGLEEMAFENPNEVASRMYSKLQQKASWDTISLNQQLPSSSFTNDREILVNSAVLTVSSLQKVSAAPVKIVPTKRLDNTSFDVDIPKFNPGKTSLSSRHWINFIEDIGKKLDWKHEDLKQNVGSRLDGGARDWYFRLRDRKTIKWSNFKTKLIKAFPFQEDFCSQLSCMMKRKQEDNESVISYVFHKRALLNACEITGRKAISCIVGGLPNGPLKKKIKTKHFNDFDHLYEYLRIHFDVDEDRVVEEKPKEDRIKPTIIPSSKKYTKPVRANTTSRGSNPLRGSRPTRSSVPSRDSLPSRSVHTSRDNHTTRGGPTSRGSNNIRGNNSSPGKIRRLQATVPSPW